jgi:uncharacterized protein YjbJ (UPF0337 family)
MVNENVLKGRWKEIKGEIQRAWGDLSGDELDKVQGDAVRLAGLVQKKYGLTQSDAQSKINGIIANFGSGDEKQPKSTRH